MTKLIIFDLDGVLVEAKQIHYDALNKALGEKYSISCLICHGIFPFKPIPLLRQTATIKLNILVIYYVKYL